MEANQKQNDSSVESHKEAHGEWKKLIAGYVAVAIRELSGGIIEKIRDTVHSAISRFVRSLVGLLLVLVGMVFLAVGAVQFLAEALGSLWMGYGIVGALFLIIGLLLASMGNRRGGCCGR
jgi:hypothetical protein